ncbi:RluA family pseudouridine synthase [Poseidonocella sedimentorum]|uniref:Pseudouridine synthase n=1 Tax=Poseidonocella sedimentorum TaxID=871652 RepID=A0A1I6E9H1_9RHOB|nr:RluA family pseudouridine synthase [Poseidonocella sedimentorum]SFR14297.1 ribosomal large subunit pseudouridine synthase A [Poseidonocella sedimentorum]
MPVSTPYNPPADPIEVLHEDHEIIIVNKPAGLLSVPGKGPELADCLIARLEQVFPGVLLVHRLDRDTSGVMVFAQTPNAQRHLGLQFEKRQVRKIYIARVAGCLDPAEGEIDLPLTVDWPNRPLQKVDHETGRPAQTRYKAVKTGPEESRVRLFPKTGRSHQLRVHMLAIGHPILGDPLYAEETLAAHSRLMLHSEELRLRHPDGGRGLRFRAKTPF